MSCLMLVPAPTASFDQVADKVSPELCGSDESHVSGLSI